MSLGSIYKFSPDGSRLAAVSPDGRLAIWNSNSEMCEQYSPSCHLESQISTMSWCPASHIKLPKKNSKISPESTADFIALGTCSGSVLMYSVRQGDVSTVLDSSLVKINCITWSHTSKNIFVGAEDGMISIFSILNLELAARMRTGNDGVYSLTLSSDSKRLISGSRNIQVWETKTQTLLQTFIGHANEVRWLTMLERNKMLYILSAAEDDRNISVWKLRETEKPKKPESVHSTLSVNETIADIAVLPMSEDDIYTSVTTTSGSVQIFHYDFTKKSSAPIKPRYTVQIASEKEKKVTQIPVFSSHLRNQEEPTLTLAYGSETKIQLEELKVTDLKNKHLLHRDMPTLQLGGDKVKDFSKVVKPKIPDGVKYLVAGHPLPLGLSKGTKRKPDNADIESLSLEERLTLLDSKTQKTGPKTDTMAQLLVQGLHSKDANILNSVLDRDDPELIDNTVKSLPVETVVPLLSVLMKRVQGRGNTAKVRWTHSVLRNHAGYLISAPNVQKDILMPLNDIISARVSNYPQVLRLKGKIDMIKGQMERNKTEAPTQVNRAPLLVYQDESEDEYSDVLNKLSAPSQGVDEDSDYLDEFLSNGESDEDEDVDEVQEVNGKMNGHLSGSEEEEGMDED